MRYRGYYYDTDTNLYYLQSRYYDADIGRFINADDYKMLTSNPTDSNLYYYCQNNPINNIDANGLAKKKIYSSQYRNINWLTKLVAKYVGFTFSHDKKSAYIYKKSFLGVQLKIKAIFGYQISTNSMLCFGLNTKKCRSVSISVATLGKVSFSMSGGINWRKTWISFCAVQSPAFGAYFGLSAELSVSHLTSVLIIAGCAAAPYLSTFVGSVVTAISSSAAYAGTLLVPMMPRVINMVT